MVGIVLHVGIFWQRLTPLQLRYLPLEAFISPVYPVFLLRLRLPPCILPHSSTYPYPHVPCLCFRLLLLRPRTFLLHCWILNPRSLPPPLILLPLLSFQWQLSNWILSLCSFTVSLFLCHWFFSLLQPCLHPWFLCFWLSAYPLVSSGYATGLGFILCPHRYYSSSCWYIGFN